MALAGTLFGKHVNDDVSCMAKSHISLDRASNQEVDRYAYLFWWLVTLTFSGGRSVPTYYRGP